jgi:citrate synthase
MQLSDTMRFLVNGKTLAAPAISSTLGPSGALIVGFERAFDVLAFDPSLSETVFWTSQVTFTDAESGQLLYRGYPIEELVLQSSYLDVVYLLLNGEMPSRDERLSFERDIRNEAMLHEQLRNFLNGFRRDAHPMSILCSVVGAMSSFYDELNVSDERGRQRNIRRILAKMPTIAAWSRKYALGQPFIYPSNALSFTDNLLHMLKAVPPEDFEVDREHARALDQILIAHADHAQSPSTVTVRMAGLTGANPFACIAAGLASFWGPRHGGADGTVMAMLSEIGRPERVKDYVSRAISAGELSKVPGVGHPLYGANDPRARIMRRLFERLRRTGTANGSAETGTIIGDVAQVFVEVVEQTDEFANAGLLPNLDFYTSINLHMIGFPSDMFTVVLAVARAAGWLSHWNEMLRTSDCAGRMRQIYTGLPRRTLSRITD